MPADLNSMYGGFHNATLGFELSSLIGFSLVETPVFEHLAIYRFFLFDLEMLVSTSANCESAGR